ncbi:3-methyl-2-oxobutanoate hydroxymethyltransferase [Azomonas macrocytogenes]|uniref:3-methyl-2-oxobutanoate hydroxymethyltransferase n=1 Tax=Azomonas macrocytogenes TaxID=69962 RepID=A0A839T8K7_AZOMA|nr:3-methyl-2-oxobutanoate hydroxymethyltransferase [Azomonas macrocytogenes]
MKANGEKWAILTAYDMYTAEIFETAGIPVLLVGDSASNNVFGYDSTLTVTVDELIPLARAVSRSAHRALVIADLPFGSYQASAEQCFHTAVRFMKEGGAHAIKIEGGIEILPQVEKLVSSGIPVMAHIGFTPQAEHQLGGYRVQGAIIPSACLKLRRRSRELARSRYSSKWCPVRSQATSPGRWQSLLLGSAPATSATLKYWCGRTWLDYVTGNCRDS